MLPGLSNTSMALWVVAPFRIFCSALLPLMCCSAVEGLSPALESPGVTRSRTMPSSKGSKDVSGDEKQQQQQRTRVLRKQKRTSIQLPKKSEPIASP